MDVCSMMAFAVVCLMRELQIEPVDCVVQPCPFQSVREQSRLAFCQLEERASGSSPDPTTAVTEHFLVKLEYFLR